jgi:vesicle-fusing ATPase
VFHSVRYVITARANSRNRYKSEYSILIVDDILSLIEWNQLGARYSHTIQQALSTLLHATPPKPHHLLIIATTTSVSTLDHLGMLDLFDEQIHVPPVGDLQELKTVLEEAAAFDSDADLNMALQRTAKEARTFGIPVTEPGIPKVGVGIKTILKTVQQARSGGGSQDVAGSFASKMVGHMSRAQS